MSTVEELTFQRDRWIKRTWCEIDLDCLKDNITLIQSLAKKTVIGVVKANAYGPRGCDDRQGAAKGGDPPVCRFQH